MLKLSLTLALCAQSLVCLAQSVTPGVPLAQQLQEAIAKDDAPKVAYMLRELAYDPNFSGNWLTTRIFIFPMATLL